MGIGENLHIDMGQVIVYFECKFSYYGGLETMKECEKLYSSKNAFLGKNVSSDEVFRRKFCFRKIHWLVSCVNLLSNNLTLRFFKISQIRYQYQ